LDFVILRFRLDLFAQMDTLPAPGLFPPQFGSAITCLETGFSSECRVFKREIMHGVADAWCLFHDGQALFGQLHNILIRNNYFRPVGNFLLL